MISTGTTSSLAGEAVEAQMALPPRVAQAKPSAQVPQEPPQPSSPQALSVQEATTGQTQVPVSQFRVPGQPHTPPQPSLLPQEAPSQVLTQLHLSLGRPGVPLSPQTETGPGDSSQLAGSSTLAAVGASAPIFSGQNWMEAPAAVAGRASTPPKVTRKISTGVPPASGQDSQSCSVPEAFRLGLLLTRASATPGRSPPAMTTRAPAGMMTGTWILAAPEAEASPTEQPCRFRFRALRFHNSNQS